LYLQSSKRKFPKPCLETAFKYCLGIIASVSILFLISGIAIDLKVLNLFIYNSRASAMFPFIADAAAVAGLAK
jgi:hypothetical protein